MWIYNINNGSDYKDDKIEFVNIKIKGGTLECTRLKSAGQNINREITVQRLYSTDPMLFLKDEFSPGRKITCAQGNSG